MKFLIPGFIFILIFHYSLIFNLDKPLGLTHGDSFQTNFILKHYIDTAKAGNWLNLANLPMVYPLKNSLFYSEGHFLQGISAILINFLTGNIITTTNILALLTIFFTFLSMDFLAFFWTKNYWASLTAGLIFAFGPFVLARFPDQMIVYSLYFIPLIFLFAEKFVRDPKGKSGFWLCAFLICQLLSSSFYYGAFLLIFLPVYLLGRTKQLKVTLKDFLNFWNLAGITVFVCVVLIVGYFQLQVFGKEAINRDLIDAESYSAWPSDYFFANKRNLFYGKFKDYVLDNYPDFKLSKFASLNGLFLGIIPIILLFVSFRLVKGSQKGVFNLFWGLWFLAFILSFGPKIHLTQELTLPGPYRIIYEIPIFKFLRDISRFGTMIVFFTSLISAMALNALMEKLPKKRIFAIIIIALITLEYWNKPLDFTNFTQEKIQFYDKVNSDPKIRVVLDYPIGNSLNGKLEGARPSEFDAYYLLLASTLHNKILFNGYNAFLPKEYYKRANQISIFFPTVLKIKLLKEWGIDAIVLHKDQFFDPNQFEIIRSRFNALGLKSQTGDKEVLYTLYD